MDKQVLFFVLVSVLAGANLGTVRHTEDPIRDTQTDAISFQQKMEEEKDGVKGPLAYSVKYNPKDTFFVDPPMEDEGKPQVKENANTEKPPTLSDWWEEKPVQGMATSSQEETIGESRPAEEKVPLSGENVGKDEGASSGPSKDASSNDSWW